MWLSPVCGGYLYDPEGVIKTINFPRSNYWSNQNCEWTIRVRTGKTIRLEFDAFDVLNTTAACSGDYLIVSYSLI